MNDSLFNKPCLKPSELYRPTPFLGNWDDLAEDLPSSHAKRRRAIFGSYAPHTSQTKTASRFTAARRLNGHGGCVNRLCWHPTGDILASVSDDRKAILWNYNYLALFGDSNVDGAKIEEHGASRQEGQPAVIRDDCKTVINTHHRLNIFAVRFLPSNPLADSFSETDSLVTGALDGETHIYEISTGTPLIKYKCNERAVTAVTASDFDPFLFWTSSDDGTIREFDTRQPHTCGNWHLGECPNVLVSTQLSLALPDLRTLKWRPDSPEHHLLYQRHLARLEDRFITPHFNILEARTRCLGAALSFRVGSEDVIDVLRFARKLMPMRDRRDISSRLLSMAVNPLRPEYILVGASDPMLRVYDRRFMSLGRATTWPENSLVLGSFPVAVFSPASISFDPTGDVLGDTPLLEYLVCRDSELKYATHVEWDPKGNFLMGAFQEDAIYTFKFDATFPPENHTSRWPPTSKRRGPKRESGEPKETRDMTDVGETRAKRDSKRREEMRDMTDIEETRAEGDSEELDEMRDMANIGEMFETRDVADVGESGITRDERDSGEIKETRGKRDPGAARDMTESRALFLRTLDWMKKNTRPQTSADSFRRRVARIASLLDRAESGFDDAGHAHMVRCEALACPNLETVNEWVVEAGRLSGLEVDELHDLLMDDLVFKKTFTAICSGLFGAKTNDARKFLSQIRRLYEVKRSFSLARLCRRAKSPNDSGLLSYALSQALKSLAVDNAKSFQPLAQTLTKRREWSALASLYTFAKSQHLKDLPPGRLEHLLKVVLTMLRRIRENEREAANRIIWRVGLPQRLFESVISRTRNLPVQPAQSDQQVIDRFNRHSFSRLVCNEHIKRGRSPFQPHLLMGLTAESRFGFYPLQQALRKQKECALSHTPFDWDQTALSASNMESRSRRLIEDFNPMAYRPTPEYQRYEGAVNRATDVKECAFWGSNLVVGASDGGAIFVWRRSDCLLVDVLCSHLSSVNCVRPHPRAPVLASSGMDSFILLWIHGNPPDELNMKLPS